MAAPQGPCPLPGGAGLAGIESRDDDSPPHGHAAWRGARSGRIGSWSGAFVRLCRTKAQASRPWIHAAFGPCSTRAVLAATNVAAHAGGKEHVTHRAVNIILQQSVTSNWLDTVYSLLMKPQHSSDVLKIVFLIEKT